MSADAAADEMAVATAAGACWATRRAACGWQGMERRGGHLLPVGEARDRLLEVARVGCHAHREAHEAGARARTADL